MLGRRAGVRGSHELGSDEGVLPQGVGEGPAPFLVGGHRDPEPHAAQGLMPVRISPGMGSLLPSVFHRPPVVPAGVWPALGGPILGRVQGRGQQGALLALLTEPGEEIARRAGHVGNESGRDHSTTYSVVIGRAQGGGPGLVA